MLTMILPLTAYLQLFVIQLCSWGTKVGKNRELLSDEIKKFKHSAAVYVFRGKKGFMSLSLYLFSFLD